MDRVTEPGETRAARKHRRRTLDEKRRIVEETLSSGRSVAEIARAHEVNANQVFDWRRQYLEGRLGQTAQDSSLLPVVVHDSEGGPVDEPAARNGRGTEVSGTIRVQLRRWEIHIEGRPDPDTLRTVIECLSR
jgi:transposase